MRLVFGKFILSFVFVPKYCEGFEVNVMIASASKLNADATESEDEAIGISASCHDVRVVESPEKACM